MFCDQYKVTWTVFLQEITDKTGIVIKGSETDILSALLEKKALGIWGRYLEIMYLERGAHHHLAASEKWQ